MKHSSNKRKILDDTSEHPETQKETNILMDKIVLKKTCLRQSRQSSDQNEDHYIVPQGFIWSNNSCAYDSIFVIFYILWCSNKNLWSDRFHSIGN